MFLNLGVHSNESVKEKHSPCLIRINWKRCKIGCMLVLFTNMKSYTGFRLVPKSINLNDLKQYNGR